MTEIGAYQSPTAHDHGGVTWPKLHLSSRHQQAWLETRTALLVLYPAFADVFLSMMVDDNKDLAWFTDQIPIAATDDKILYLNPNTFFQYPPEERLFILCHEILHCIFSHCGMMYYVAQKNHITYPDGVKLPFHAKIMQPAMDCLINDMLVNSNTGKIPERSWHYPTVINMNDDLYGAYRKLYKAPPPPPPPSSGSGGKGNYQSKIESRSFDEHLQPGTGRGKFPAEAIEERNQQKWDNAVRAAIKSAREQGKLPLSLDRGLSKLLEPQVDWREHLNFATVKQIGHDRSSWNLLDNELMVRGIGAPGKQSHGCDLVIFATDSSGSVNQLTENMFMSECAGIMQEIRPRKIILMQCDAKIQEYVEIDDPEELIRPIKGGGGTDFRPVFQRIQDEGLDPDCLVYLTDLEGTFPAVAPPYPVIWGVIGRERKVPFGEVVAIPKQAT